MMKWLTSCLLPRQPETKCCSKKGRGRLRESEVLFPLDDHVVAMQSYSPTRHLAGSYPESPSFEELSFILSALVTLVTQIVETRFLSIGL